MKNSGEVNVCNINIGEAVKALPGEKAKSRVEHAFSLDVLRNCLEIVMGRTPDDEG